MERGTKHHPRYKSPSPTPVTNQTLRRLQPRFFQPLSIAALIESRRILSSGGSTVNKDGRFFPSARTHAPPTDSIVRVLAGQTVLNSASQSDVWHGNVERCIKHAASSLFHGKRKRESALRPSSRLLSLPGERGSLPPSPPPPPRFYCSSNVYLSKTKGATVPTWIRLPRASRLPVRIDSGAMRCRTFSATPPAILPIILHPPCYLLPPCFLITRSFRIGYN